MKSLFLPHENENRISLYRYEQFEKEEKIFIKNYGSNH